MICEVTCRYSKNNELLLHETIKEPQLPKHDRGLGVTLRVTQCAGRISANTRPHQLRWGDWGDHAIVLNRITTLASMHTCPMSLIVGNKSRILLY